NPPGTTRMFVSVAVAKSECGSTRKPPVVSTGPGRAATVKTSKGALSSERRDSTPGVRRVRENTSKGPAKSRTSTPSKRRMPTRTLSIPERLLPSRRERSAQQERGGLDQAMHGRPGLAGGEERGHEDRRPGAGERETPPRGADGRGLALDRTGHQRPHARGHV